MLYGISRFSPLTLTDAFRPQGQASSHLAAPPVTAIEPSLATDTSPDGERERNNPQNRDRAFSHMIDQATKAKSAPIDTEAWAREMHVRVQLYRQLG